MRVLIADDEYKVCQLIIHLVHWEDYGMEIIGTASDGEEALELICSEKPDIVITDIQMPGLDGIKLVERTSQIVENVYFVIVSGYSQFEYARQAVRLGVEDYLVKPIRKKDLEAVLQKIKEKHKKAEDGFNKYENLKTELIQTREKLKNNLLQDLLFSENFTFQQGQEKEYGYEFRGISYRMILVHLFDNSMDSDSAERIFVLKKITKMLHERMIPLCHECLCTFREHEAICLLDTEKIQQAVLDRQMVKLITDISNIQGIFSGVNTLVVVGNEFADLENCRIYLHAMQTFLLDRFRQSRQIIFLDDHKEENIADLNVLLTPDFRKNFLRKIELLNVNNVACLIDEFQENLRQHNQNPEYFFAVYREFVGVFLIGTQSHYKDAEPCEMKDFLHGLDVFFDYDDLFEWLKQNIVNYIERQEQRIQDLESRPVRMAKKYINTHFRENLNLETVGKEVGLNPAYFSSIFKKDTGQNFTEYVISVRMENAKRLLLQTNKELIDISYEVGYQDVKYFTKLFKKSYSLTPTEYRKLYR